MTTISWSYYVSAPNLVAAVVLTILLILITYKVSRRCKKLNTPMARNTTNEIPVIGPDPIRKREPNTLFKLVQGAEKTMMELFVRRARI